MKINVQVKPRCKKEAVEKLSDSEFIVRVNTPPIDGKANLRVVELLSEFYSLPKSKIVLKRGQKSKRKVFCIQF
jgi:hypothetical protein